jgi:hypothetical protein
MKDIIAFCVFCVSSILISMYSYDIGSKSALRKIREEIISRGFGEYKINEKGQIDFIFRDFEKN